VLNFVDNVLGFGELPYNKLCCA